MEKKMLVTVSGNDVTDFDIMRAFMSIGLSVKIEVAPDETAQPLVEPTMLDDVQIYKMPEPKVIVRGRFVWDDPNGD